MKIAITSSGPDLNAQIDPRFGRCPYFLIIDSKTKKFEAIKNSGVQAFQGAGLTAAQIVADKKVKAVIAGNFGPKAIYILKESGIKIFRSPADITAEESFKRYQKGELEEVKI